MKPGTPPLKSARLLVQVQERVRYLHYSLKTEKAYLYWIRFFIRWNAAQGSGMRHPRNMGVTEVEAFLTMMATECKASASTSTHSQALSALLFLYREVLNIDLPWLNNIGRPQQTKRIPSVLTKDEVAGLLAQMDGITALLAKLLYGTGMRLMEGIRLRIKDVDFDHHIIIVREAKGGEDRVVMLPHSLAPTLRLQMLAARAQWEADRQRFSLTNAVVSSGGTICLKSGYSGRSRRQCHWLAFTSQFQSTPCAIHLPPTFCKLAQTSARCKSCWVTRMSAPP
jgi:site-specific recombinase XerD